MDEIRIAWIPCRTMSRRTETQQFKQLRDSLSSDSDSICYCDYETVCAEIIFKFMVKNEAINLCGRIIARDELDC